VEPARQCETTGCQRIRVLVVDEHQAVRHAIATLIASLDDMELAGVAASAEEALSSTLSGAPPDVALMATTRQGKSAAGDCRALRRRWPSLRVVGLCTFLEEGQAQAVLDAGAVGYLLKNVSAGELLGAVRAAHAMQRAQEGGASDIRG